MLKYGLIALVCFVFLYTLYQLYLNTTWTKLVRSKQSQYTQTPSVKSDNKRLYHQLEVCAVSLVAVLFLPTTPLKNYSADAANFYTGDTETMESNTNGVYDLARIDEVSGGNAVSSQGTPKAATTTAYKLAETDIFDDSLNGFVEYSISVKAMHENASKEEVEELLEVWDSKEWIEADVTSISDPQHVITITNEDYKQQYLFFKSDSDKYWLCVEEGPKCYYTKK